MSCCAKQEHPACIRYAVILSSGFFPAQSESSAATARIVENLYGFFTADAVLMLNPFIPSNSVLVSPEASL
jgi:hypothetical protein